MRNIITILLFLAPVLSNGQNLTPQGTVNGGTRQRGGFAVDSMIRIPDTKDTTAWFGVQGNLAIRPQDGRLYYRSNGSWKSVDNGGGGNDTAKNVFSGTLSQSRALTSTPDLVVTTDFGGGTWIKNDTVTVDNTGTQIVTAAGQGYSRIYDGALDVTWFGAKGDSLTVNNLSFQKAINVAKSTNSGFISIPKGVFILDSGVVVHKGVGIKGYGGVILRKTPFSKSYFQFELHGDNIIDGVIYDGGSDFLPSISNPISSMKDFIIKTGNNVKIINSNFYKSTGSIIGGTAPSLASIEGDVYSVIISGNSFGNFRDHHIYLQGINGYFNGDSVSSEISGVVINGNTFYDSGETGRQSIKIKNISTVTVSDNVVKMPNTRFLNIDISLDAPLVGDNSKLAVVSGNTGICLTFVDFVQGQNEIVNGKKFSDVIISGNSVVSSISGVGLGLTPDVGASIPYSITAERILISDNIITSSRPLISNGSTLTGIDEIKLTNNILKVDGRNTAIFYFGNLSNLTASGNTVIFDTTLSQNEQAFINTTHLTTSDFIDFIPNKIGSLSFTDNSIVGGHAIIVEENPSGSIYATKFNGYFNSNRVYSNRNAAMLFRLNNPLLKDQLNRFYESGDNYVIGNVFANGNVLGATSPASPNYFSDFVVKPNINTKSVAAINFEVPNNIGFYNIRNSSNVLSKFAFATSGNALIVGDNDNNFSQTLFKGNTNVRFQQNGLDVITLTSGNATIGSLSNNGAKLDIRGSISLPVTSVSSTYSATNLDHTILVNSSSAPVTITLPSGAANNRIFTVKKIDPSLNSVTIVSPNTIDLGANYTLSNQHQAVSLQSDGTNYRVLSSTIYTKNQLDSITNTRLPRSFTASNGIQLNGFNFTIAPTNTTSSVVSISGGSTTSNTNILWGSNAIDITAPTLRASSLTGGYGYVVADSVGKLSKISLDTNVVSNAATLSLTTKGYYSFNGTTTTWTLGAVAPMVTTRYVIANMGSGAITVNAPSNTLWEAGTTMSSTTISAGETAIIYSNGIYWTIYN